MIHTLNTLSAAVALQLIHAAFAEAGSKGSRVAVAIVDVQGLPLASLRMDNVSPPVLEFAQDKAYTAATMRRSTHAFHDRMSGSPALALGFANRARLTVWGGGLPIFHNGGVVGGIGVAGATDQEDVDCAKAALTQAGLRWEA